MKLNVNKEHKKANISSIVAASCLTLVVGASHILFINNGYSSEQKQYYFNEISDLMYSYEDNISCVKDFDKISYVKINANNDNSWINNCKYLDKIELTIKNDDISNLNYIRNIPNLRELSIKSLRDNNDVIFNADNFGFLKNCHKLYKISFDNVQVDHKFLEKFSTLETINFKSDTYFNCNCDFTKFPNLSCVNFGDLKTYNLGMFLNPESIEYFKSNNILVSSNEDSNLKENLIKIDNELEHILKRFNGVDKNSSDKDKLNAILKYLTMNFDYSEKFLNMSSTEQKNYKKEMLYKNGYLYGSLFNNGEVICGNYASLFQALANRLDLESYFITSNDHAWNLVNVDDNYYYTDVTWLDDNDPNLYDFLNNNLNVLNSNESISLEWYLKEPSVYSDESHVANSSPYKIDIYLDEKNGNDFTKWKYKVNLFKGDVLILSLLSLCILLGIYWYLVFKNIKENEKITQESIKKL